MPYRINIDTRTTGPLFRGVVPGFMDKAAREVQVEVADYALFQWRINLENSWQNPTGRYMSHTQQVRRGPDIAINDGYPESNILYGPWLEGVGSRNATTRFKGYFAMRRATNSVQQKVAAIARPIIDKWVKVSNGV